MIKNNIIKYLLLTLIFYGILTILTIVFTKKITVVLFEFLIIMTLLIIVNLSGFIYSVIKSKKTWALILQFVFSFIIVIIVLTFSHYNEYEADFLLSKLPIPFLLAISNVLSYMVAYLIHRLEKTSYKI